MKTIFTITLISMSLVVFSQSKKKVIAQRQDSIESAKITLNELTNQINDLDKKYVELSKEIEETNAEIEKVKSKIENLNSEIFTGNAKLKDLKTEKKALQDDIAEKTTFYDEMLIKKFEEMNIPWVGEYFANDDYIKITSANFNEVRFALKTEQVNVSGSATYTDASKKQAFFENDDCKITLKLETTNIPRYRNVRVDYKTKDKKKQADPNNPYSGFWETKVSFNTLFMFTDPDLINATLDYFICPSYELNYQQILKQCTVILDDEYFKEQYYIFYPIYSGELIFYSKYKTNYIEYYKLIEILSKDVDHYYNLMEKYDTDLKLHAFKNTEEYKQLSIALSKKADTWKNDFYYLYLYYPKSDYDSFSYKNDDYSRNTIFHTMKDYNLNTKAFDFTRHKPIYGNSKIYYNIKGLNIFQPSKSIEEIFRLHIDEATALKIENANKKDLAFFIIFKPGTVAKKNSYDEDGRIKENGILNINKYRMVLMNIETGELYYDKIVY